jgi:hypothetical protein
MPTGFCGVPGRGSAPIAPGLKAPAKLTSAIAAAGTQATGRQRGDGSEPSGTSSNSSGTSPTTGNQKKFCSHIASTPPGTDPGLVRSA